MPAFLLWHRGLTWLTNIILLGRLQALPYAIQCLSILSTIKFKLREKKRRKQSRIKKSHSPSIRSSCCDPKASFSCLLKLTPLRRALNCNNSSLIGHYTTVEIVYPEVKTGNFSFWGKETNLSSVSFPDSAALRIMRNMLHSSSPGLLLPL